MNYSNFSREQLLDLVDHLKANFIPDNVLFRSHSLITVDKLSEALRSLQNNINTLNGELKVLRQENHDLKQQVENISPVKENITNKKKTTKKSK